MQFPSSLLSSIVTLFRHDRTAVSLMIGAVSWALLSYVGASPVLGRGTGLLYDVWVWFTLTGFITFTFLFIATGPLLCDGDAGTLVLVRSSREKDR